VNSTVECGVGEDGYQKKVKGGAVQLVLQKVSFDSYPYHRAGMYTLLYVVNNLSKNADEVMNQ